MGQARKDSAPNESDIRKSSLRSQSSQEHKGKKVAKSRIAKVGNKKDIGATASSTNSHFISSKARARYHTLVGRTFTFERGVKMKDLEETGLMKVLINKRWLKLACTPPKSCENLVREFYANFLLDLYLEGKGTKVRDIDVIITPTLINRYFRTPEIADSDDYTAVDIPKQQIVLDLYGSEIENTGKHYLYQQFTVEFAFWCMFTSHNLLPSKHFTKINEPRARLVHAIGTNRPINVGKCIFKAIYDAGIASRYGLPFPALISQFCLNTGVPRDQEDISVPPPKPIGGVTYDTLYEQIMNGPKPIAERKAKQNRPDTKASSSVNDSDPLAWVSKIMGAIHALQEHQEHAIVSLKVHDNILASLTSQLTQHGDSLAHLTQILRRAKQPSTTIQPCNSEIKWKGNYCSG